MTDDVFDERLYRIEVQTKRLGVLEYQNKILPVLYEIDRACAVAGSEMIRHHTPEDLHEQFSTSWVNLKRLIYEIERREINEKTN